MTQQRPTTSLGLEMEMVVADAQTGASRLVNRYFASLAQLKLARGQTVHPVYSKGRCIGIDTAQAHCGLDNGLNLLETALEPASNLNDMARRTAIELSDSLKALSADGLTVLNASQHPTCPRDGRWYAWARTHRPIYEELVTYRHWAHHEGIDAKAQNGVNISVPVADAAQALNITMALAPASIALFANSPLESGRLTGLKENRLTLWPRVFRSARFAGDFYLQQYPQRPFFDLGDYFRWMFGPATVSRSLALDPSDGYKSTAGALLLGDPCLHDFLYAPKWPAQRLDTGKIELIRPSSAHFVSAQIAAFLDARFRYRLTHFPPLDVLLSAWSREGGLEALFDQCGIDAYIECRAPGANFADDCLLCTAGPEAARSVLMAPMALQLGLMRRLDQAWELVNDWGWEALGKLRAFAVRYGLDDDRVYALSEQVVCLAYDGLEADERAWLAYAHYAVANRECGADRLIQSWQALPNGAGHAARLRYVLGRHTALCPTQFGFDMRSE